MKMAAALAGYQALFGLTLLGISAAAPFLPGRVRRIAEGWHDYFGNLPRPPAGPLAWVHGVSMGESAVAGAVMHGLRARAPQVRLGFTTTHPDVLADVRKKKRADVAGYFPLDAWFSMNRAFERWNPRMVILAETDFWPVFSQTCLARKIPLALVNGRISDKLHRFYTQFRIMGKAVFEPFSLLAVQSESDAGKLREMGAHPERIVVTGNAKVDLVPPAGSPAARVTALWAGKARLLVFGSMHPSEFEAFLPVWKKMTDAEDDTRLLLAPRNPANAPAWEERLKSAGISVVRRSQLGDVIREQKQSRVLLLDTMGELAALYGLASAAFVGGSLDPDVGGHNPLEVLNQGVPLVMGPHVRNFADLVNELVAAGAMEQADSAEMACEIINNILKYPAGKTTRQDAAEKVLRRHRGALDRTLDLIIPLLPQ